MLRQPAEGRRERFLEATVWVSHVCHASANNLSKVRGLADESMTGKCYRPCGYYMPILLWVPTRIFVAIGVDVLIVLGMARDFIVSRSIHRVYVYALLAFIACQIAVAYTYETSYWVKIAHAILG